MDEQEIKAVPVHAMKAYSGSGGRTRGNSRIGGLVRTKTGVDVFEKYFYRDSNPRSSSL